MNKIEFLNQFGDLEEKAIALADKIFDTPEFGYQEVKSSAYLKNFLREEGFSIEENVASIPTAFVAKYGKGKPVIGLLAEYDALAGLSQEAGTCEPKPLVVGGYGHGCGHNLLGTGCAFSAVLVKKYLEQKNLKGTIIVFGCPAEEQGSGKAFMAKEGVFKNVDCALTWHPAEYTCVVPASTMGNIQVQYTFTGRASHAGVAPHMGRSALDAVELMNVGANYLREHIIRDAQLHYAVTDTGGLSPNVVQAHASVLYLIRGPKISDVMQIKERVDKVAQGASLMTGTNVEIKVKKACSHFLPNQTIGQEVYKSIQEVGLPSFSEEDVLFARAIRETTPTQEESTGLAKKLAMQMVPRDKVDHVKKVFCDDINLFVMPANKLNMTLPGSSDCGDVSLNCPTAWLNYVTCAQGTPGHSWQMVAQGKSDMSHKGMIQAGKTLSHTILNLFENEEILKEAWKEFYMETKNQEYVSPIPSDVLPPLHQ